MAHVSFSPLCGVLFFLLHLLAPPPPPPSPSAFLLPPLYYNISHTTSLTTTSLRQHPTHNVSHTTSLRTTSLTTTSHAQQHTHTTSLTQHRMPRGRMCASLLQHLSQQHHSENIPHTTSHTQQHTHNMTHTTSPTRPHRRRFRGRRSTLLLVKGSDVRPSVASSLCIWFHTPQMDCPCSQLCCL